VTPELLPPLKGKKTFSKKTKKAVTLEDDTNKKRAQQRRSTSDLGRHRDEEGSLVGREMRTQALAKQSASLRTINEREHEAPRVAPRITKKRSAEENGRTSIMLGADVSRAMRWAEGYERPEKSKAANKPKIEKVVDSPPPVEKPLPTPVTALNPESEAPIRLIYPETESKPLQEIPREPIVAPKVHVSRSKSPEPAPPTVGPILLSPDTSFNKSSEKQKSPPNKLKKFFGGKSKEEREAKRASRSMSPLPPTSPTPPKIQPRAKSPTPPVSHTPIPPPLARSPTPVIDTKEWEEDFDGTHRQEASTPTPQKPKAYLPKVTASQIETYISAPKIETFVPPKIEEYRPATPPTVPITKRSETPTRDRTPEDEDLDRWAQIRKAAGQRALNRAVAPSRNHSEDVTEVNIPRARPAIVNPKRGKGPLKPDEEDEESVDARVARIRKRVQELTAGMGDD
jgi:hypothetical protein